jgi:hypothetical protein
MYSLKPDHRIADAHMGQDSAFVSEDDVNRVISMGGTANGERWLGELTDGEISPRSEDLRSCHIALSKHSSTRIDRRDLAMDGWIAGSEIRAFAHDFVARVVHDDGAICGEGAGAALLEERFVGLGWVRQ